jgi:hypothetical protein
MMIRIVINLNKELDLPLQPLVWALAFGACLGGWFVFSATAPPPQGTGASSFTRFLDHTQRRLTVGRTPLDV